MKKQTRRAHAHKIAKDYRQANAMFSLVAISCVFLGMLFVLGCSKSPSTLIQSKPIPLIHTNKNQHFIANTNTVAVNSEYLQPNLGVDITNSINNFLHDLEVFQKNAGGTFPSKDELHSLARSHAVDDAFLALMHEGLYTLKGTGALTYILEVLTNTALASIPPDIANFYLHSAGVANERNGKLRDAIRYYEAVIQRAYNNISNKEASDSAFFLASIYKKLRDYKKAQYYYEIFAEFSENCDHNHENAIFAKIQLAELLLNVEPKKTVEYCTALIVENPKTKHMVSINQVKYVADELVRDPNLKIGELYNKASVLYPMRR